jgi:hypothetical protein
MLKFFARKLNVGMLAKRCFISNKIFENYNSKGCHREKECKYRTSKTIKETKSFSSKRKVLFADISFFFCSCDYDFGQVFLISVDFWKQFLFVVSLFVLALVQVLPFLLQRRSICIHNQNREKTKKEIQELSSKKRNEGKTGIQRVSRLKQKIYIF